MASIKQRGDAYRITVSLGRDKQDRKITKSVTYRPVSKTQKKIEQEVAAFAKDYEQRVLNDLYITGDEVTFEAFALDVWMPNWLLRNNKVGQRSKEDYERVLRQRLIPALGHMKLNKIKARHIDSILHGMTDAGLAAKTVRHVYGVMNSIMKYALKKEYLKENPCLRCDDLPTVTQDNELHYFTVEQARRFLDFLDEDVTVYAAAHTRTQESGEYDVASYQYTKTVSIMWKAFFSLAIFGGFRRGELCALTWKDVDFDDRIISINKAMSKTKGSGEIVKDPKTRAGIRDISVPDECFSILRQWKNEERRLMLRYGTAWEGSRGDFDDQNVFIQLQNGRPIRVDSPTHKFRELLERYNAQCEDESQKLPLIRLHDLRHTMITLLFSMGMDPETLSKRAGHSKPSVTMDIYGHAMRSQDRKAADILQSAFFAEN